MSQLPPKNRPQTRQVPTRSQNAGSGGRASGGAAGRGGPPPRYPNDRRPRNVAPQRDPFPYIMGGIIGALVIGLMAVIFLIANNNNNNNNTAQQPPVVATQDPNITVAPTEQPAPRMPIEAFMTLYNDPAKRPLIIDVRPVDSFNEGHIAGAISFPEADVDARVKELPKDKMIVAYCQ